MLTEDAVLALQQQLDSFGLPLSILDLFGLASVLAAWAGYSWWADHGPQASQSLSNLVAEHRRRWIRAMVARENRILDSQLLGNIVGSVGFFASATLILLGAVVAGLGASDKALDVLNDLPFAVPMSVGSIEVRMLVIAGMLIYAFFKFAWSYRLFNHTSVVFGSAPTPRTDLAVIDRYVSASSRLMTLAARHFNFGIRAYFFTLASLAWFVHPLLLPLAAAGVVNIMFQREFRSPARRALVDALDATETLWPEGSAVTISRPPSSVPLGS